MSTLIAYNARIDGLRAVAVLLVIFHHWLPASSWVNWTPNGQLGVDLFFVLSGYLITGILLRFRAAVERGPKRPGRALGDFYVRRSLRLFPLYYVALAGAAVWPFAVSGVSIRASWPWYAAFLQNHFTYVRGAWDGFLSHFWSLAVEEQFYLLWGVAVLLLPRPALIRLVGCGIAAALAFRGYGVLVSAGNVESMSFWNILTPSCFDALGLGSLAALARDMDAGLYARLKRCSEVLSIPAALFITTFRYAPAIWYVGGRLAVALLGIRLLSWALDGRPSSWFGRIAELRPVVEFGRRSYGLYVFHNLVPFLWHSVGSIARTHIAGWPVWADTAFVGNGRLLFWPPLLLLLAFGSWHFFESPISRLKDRFAP